MSKILKYKNLVSAIVSTITTMVYINVVMGSNLYFQKSNVKNFLFYLMLLSSLLSLFFGIIELLKKDGIKSHAIFSIVVGSLVVVSIFLHHLNSWIL